MAVLDPIKLVITNYQVGKEEWLDAENSQQNPNLICCNHLQKPKEIARLKVKIAQ
jgi:hypothetical protein